MKIIQNVKSGFESIKELFGIMLSDESEIPDNYDFFINSSDAVLAKTAKELKQIEKEQEAKRVSLLGEKVKKSK